MRHPFYRKSLSCWYCKDNAGRFIRLSPDKEEAHRIWAAMLESGKALSHPCISFAALAAEWLEEFEAILSKDRFESAGRYIGQFIDWSTVPFASDIKPSHVKQWLEEQKHNNKQHKKPIYWKESTKRDAAHSVKRVLTWAVEQGYLKKNPLAMLALSESEPREFVLSEESHAKVIRFVRSQRGGNAFALYLIASRCGARPKQIREVTADNVHPNGTLWIFRKHKTRKKTKKPLIVPLSPCLQTITRILANTRPTGPLFRQANGQPWKRNGVSLRIRRFREQLNMPELIAYSYRHTFATDALLAEVPLATVSAMLGHCDTRMVSQVYGHLDSHLSYLVDAAAKVARKRAN